MIDWRWLNWIIDVLEKFRSLNHVFFKYFRNDTFIFCSKIGWKLVTIRGPKMMDILTQDWEEVKREDFVRGKQWNGQDESRWISIIT